MIECIDAEDDLENLGNYKQTVVDQVGLADSQKRLSCTEVSARALCDKHIASKEE